MATECSVTFYTPPQGKISNVVVVDDVDDDHSNNNNNNNIQNLYLSVYLCHKKLPPPPNWYNKERAYFP